MERLIGVAEAAHLLGIYSKTLRASDAQGTMRIVRTPGGKRRVPENELRRLSSEPAAGGLQRGAAWAIDALVSSHEQKSRGDLARQVAACGRVFSGRSAS